MAQPYVGEVRIFAGTFAPAGWELCNGQLLPISENETLFQLIGTTYGGDGQSTFGLPNLQGRVPIHQGTGSSGTPYQMSDSGGVEQVTITAQQMPTHTHAVSTTQTGQTASPSGAYIADAQSTQAGVRLYSTQAANVTMHAQTAAVVGGSQPHDNMQPYLVVNYIISMFGIFPSQT